MSLTGVDAVMLGYSKTNIINGTYPWSLDFREKFDTQIYLMKKKNQIRKIIKQHLMELQRQSVK